MANASCRACVEACPRQAFLIDDSALQLDQSACDGCGLCRPACPQNAIGFPGRSFEPYLDQDNAMALVACEPSGVDGGAGVVPCLHGLGLSDLTRVAALGARLVLAARGDCASCPRATSKTIELALAQYNLLRVSRRQDPVGLHFVAAAAWQASRQSASRRGNDLDQSRRKLFGLKSSIDKPPAGGVRDAAAAEPGVLFRFVPGIDPVRCNGCDACMRLCPHGALHFEKDASDPGYRIDAESCTGCNLCVDVCEPGAITLSTMAPVKVAAIPVSIDRCSKCGVPFHRPVVRLSQAQDGNASTGICRILSAQEPRGSSVPGARIDRRAVPVANIDPHVTAALLGRRS